VKPTPDQQARLVALQSTFAEVCNAITPLVSRTRVWHRVALHHMVYKDLRQRFPQVGSQLVCNAVYAVSRACRHVYQAPGSPVHVTLFPEGNLPVLQFASTAPVYLDRHTLSLRDGVASVYTLQGRTRFTLGMSPADECAFHEQRLLEVVLSRRGPGFQFTFHFAERAQDSAEEETLLADDRRDAGISPIHGLEPRADADLAPTRPLHLESLLARLPEYLRFESRA
jgi:hypothetical protein